MPMVNYGAGKIIKNSLYRISIKFKRKRISDDFCYNILQYIVDKKTGVHIVYPASEMIVGCIHRYLLDHYQIVRLSKAQQGFY